MKTPEIGLQIFSKLVAGVGFEPTIAGLRAWRAGKSGEAEKTDSAVCFFNSVDKSFAIAFLPRQIGGVSEVTRLLEAVRHGDARAAEELFPAVYAELRRLAAARMAAEQPGHTLQPTALVHEAWLRLGNAAGFESRSHFFGAAAEAMRRILVESARRKKTGKHGGHLERVDLDGIDVALPMPDDELLVLDEALNGLVTVNGSAAEMVKLCFFVGLTQEQAAKELGMSISTAERLWSFARAWLFREMERARSA